jgi:hypothetical protein
MPEVLQTRVARDPEGRGGGGGGGGKQKTNPQVGPFGAVVHLCKSRWRNANANARSWASGREKVRAHLNYRADIVRVVQRPA